MFMDYLLDLSSAEYENKILIIDNEEFDKRTHYSKGFENLGFDVIPYKDDLSFRIDYEKRLEDPDDKMVLTANSTEYIPYDIRSRLHAYELSFDKIFPKLDSEFLKQQNDLDLDLLSNAYQQNFDDWRSQQGMETFLREKVFDKSNVKDCLSKLLANMEQLVEKARNYHDWISIAESKAYIDVMAARFHIDMDTSDINLAFQSYILSDFGKLSTELDPDTPVLVSHAMEYMHDHSDKFVLIVMDGMSEFDWEILSSSFSDISYEKTGLFSMIPSTTSISRQCLLSNKYPIELIEPWKQKKEKQEFISCAKRLGYSTNQIAYDRGYDIDFDPIIRCGAIVINDVDDMVHAQYQGKRGMYNDIKVLSESNKLAVMIKRLLAEGFDVYLTADHGNTQCVGMGRLVGTGLDVETKSHRMVVLQNFADKNDFQSRYQNTLIDYPKYYLNKEYEYLICNIGDSLDPKGEEVMTHGGMSLDEVVVPFIKMKAVDVNG